MTDFGSCRCCAERAMVHTPADSLDGLCVTCRGRSPEECRRVHAREARAPLSLFDTLEAS